MQHRRRSVRREVVRGIEGEADVRNRQARGERVIGDPRQVERRKNELGREQRASEHDDRGREDPSGAAAVEGAEADPAGALTLIDEQPRDEEAGKNEEDVDADEAGLGAGQTGVAQEHEQDRDAPEALEIGPESGFARSLFCDRLQR